MRHVSSYMIIIACMLASLLGLTVTNAASAHGHPNYSTEQNLIFPFPNEGVNVCNNSGTSITFCQIDGNSYGVVSSINGWATATGNTITINDNSGNITLVYRNVDWSYSLQNDQVSLGDQIGTATHLTLSMYYYGQQVYPTFTGYAYSLQVYRGGFASDQTRSNGQSDTDLGTYCWYHGYAHQAKNDSNLPDGWYCVKKNGQKGPYIDFPTACIWAFGADSVSITDRSDAMRQRCYGPTPA